MAFFGIHILQNSISAGALPRTPLWSLWRSPNPLVGSGGGYPSHSTPLDDFDVKRKTDTAGPPKPNFLDPPLVFCASLAVLVVQRSCAVADSVMRLRIATRVTDNTQYNRPVHCPRASTTLQPGCDPTAMLQLSELDKDWITSGPLPLPVVSSIV